MQLKTLGASIGLCLSITAISAQEQCATMMVLEAQMQADPQLSNRLEESRARRDSVIVNSGRYFEEVETQLPPLPGFVPTGDRNVDLPTWLAIKEELYARDPDLYLELTRNSSPSKGERK